MCKSDAVEAEADDHQGSVPPITKSQHMYAFLLSGAFVLHTIPVLASLALFPEPHFWAGPIVVGGV